MLNWPPRFPDTWPTMQYAPSKDGVQGGPQMYDTEEARKHEAYMASVVADEVDFTADYYDPMLFEALGERTSDVNIGATIQWGYDSVAYVITKASPTGKTITLNALRPLDQNRDYTASERRDFRTGALLVARWSERDGCYRISYDRLRVEVGRASQWRKSFR